MRTRTSTATTASSGDSSTSAVDAPTTSMTRFSASSPRTEPVDGRAQRLGQRSRDDVGEQLLQTTGVGLRVLHVTGARLGVLDLDCLAQDGLELGDEREQVGARAERE